MLRSQCTKLQVLTLSEHALIIKTSIYFLPCQHTHTLSHLRKCILMHIYMHIITYVQARKYNNTNAALSSFPSPLLQAGCADLNRQLDSSTLRVLQLEQLVRPSCLFLCYLTHLSVLFLLLSSSTTVLLSLLLHLFTIIFVLFPTV